jgi:hypothetical protein
MNLSPVELARKAVDMAERLNVETDSAITADFWDLVLAVFSQANEATQEPAYDLNEYFDGLRQTIPDVHEPHSVDELEQVAWAFEQGMQILREFRASH